MKNQRLIAVSAAAILTLGLLSGCNSSKDGTDTVQTTEIAGTESNTADETKEAVPETVSANENNDDTMVYAPEDLETSWNQDEVTGIVFSADKIAVSGDGAEVSGTTVTIRQAGTYVLSGTMADGQVLVDAGADELVRLVLNGVELSNSHTAPVYGLQSGKIIVTLEAGTTNTISDSAEYTYANPEDDEPNAAIFSKDDLVINGSGTLVVNGNYECGVRSKDDLTVISGTITITSRTDGLKGKDSVVIRDGNIRITSGKDGIKSNNDTDSDKGYIWIDNGQITIAAQDDGIQAETRAVINGGQINITESQEGIAGLSVDINGGTINIVAQDDGINAAATVETEREKMMNQDGVYIRITGGEITIDAMADGVDSNGNLYIEGGVTYISGPTSGGDGILDYNGEASITGGILLAAGNSGMMQTFGTASTQPYLVIYYEENKTAGASVTLMDENGNSLAEYTPAKDYNTVIASAPGMESGKSYTVMAGEDSTALEISDMENSSGTPTGGRGGGFGGGGGGPRGGSGENGQPGDGSERPAGGRPEGTWDEGSRPEGGRGERPGGEMPDGTMPGSAE